MKKKIPVIITTEYRGVFFGYIDPAKKNEDVLEVERCRNVIRWTADVRGFMGLAALGPNSGCKIGPSANIELRKITSIIHVSPEALVKWEALN